MALGNFNTIMENINMLELVYIVTLGKFVKYSDSARLFKQR